MDIKPVQDPGWEAHGYRYKFWGGSVGKAFKGMCDSDDDHATNLADFAVPKSSYDLWNHDLCVALEQSYGAVRRFSGEHGTLSAMHHSLLDDREILALAMGSGDPTALMWATPRLQADRSLVELAVLAHPYALQWACPELIQHDRELVELAFRRGKDLNRPLCEMAGFVCPVSSDREMIKILAETCERAFFHLPWKFRNDTEIVQCAIAGPFTATALRLATLRLRSDRDTVLLAVRKCGEALRWASLELCDDRDIVLSAVENNAMALRWASLRLRETDRALVMFAVERCGEAVQFAEAVFCQDSEIVKAAVR